MKDTKEEIRLEEYNSIVPYYKEALTAMKLRLDSLNEEYRRKDAHCPIHYIQQRIKKKDSIEGKLRRRDLTVSKESAMENLTDIAGIRVICYFEDDIYAIVRHVKRQRDMLIIKESDYVANPKPNGYRSYHIILGVPIYHEEETEYYPVEIQIRTISMDFWASMDHKICYKKDNINHKDTMQKYAEQLHQIEQEMCDLFVDTVPKVDNDVM